MNISFERPHSMLDMVSSLLFSYGAYTDGLTASLGLSGFVPCEAPCRASIYLGSWYQHQNISLVLSTRGELI